MPLKIIEYDCTHEFLSMRAQICEELFQLFNDFLSRHNDKCIRLYTRTFKYASRCFEVLQIEHSRLYLEETHAVCVAGICVTWNP